MVSQAIVSLLRLFFRQMQTRTPLPLRGTRLANRSPMHAILFSLKRAHHATLTVSRELLRPFGLTPARFDMLCAILKHFGIAQKDLANALGVKPPTVSRMVKSLVALDLVEITGADDERIRYVHLSDKGAVLLKRTIRAVLGSGAAALVGRVASSWSCAERSVKRHFRRFGHHLRWVRYAFGDNAIRFRADQNIDQPSLRRPLALISCPPNLEEQLWGPT